MHAMRLRHGAAELIAAHSSPIAEYHTGKENILQVMKTNLLIIRR